MTRARMLQAAAALAALALRPSLSAQDEDPNQDRVEGLDRRLASIERVLVDRSIANATPAARALDSRLTRIEMRLERLEREIWNLRNRVR